jgi:phosphoserine phosphatase
VTGDVQGLGSLPSSEQAKVAAEAVEVKEKLALVEVVVAGGCAVIVVSGGGEVVAWIVQV